MTRFFKIIPKKIEKKKMEFWRVSNRNIYERQRHTSTQMSPGRGVLQVFFFGGGGGEKIFKKFFEKKNLGFTIYIFTSKKI